MILTIEEASGQLARLIEKAETGQEEIFISRDGLPVIRLAPVAASTSEDDTPPRKPRIPGLGKGQIWMAPDFNAPLPDDVMDDFYNGEIFPCKG